MQSFLLNKCIGFSPRLLSLPSISVRSAAVLGPSFWHDPLSSHFPPASPLQHLRSRSFSSAQQAQSNPVCKTAEPCAMTAACTLPPPAITRDNVKHKAHPSFSHLPSVCSGLHSRRPRLVLLHVRPLVWPQGNFHSIPWNHTPSQSTDCPLSSVPTGPGVLLIVIMQKMSSVLLLLLPVTLYLRTQLSSWGIRHSHRGVVALNMCQWLVDVLLNHITKAMELQMGRKQAIFHAIKRLKLLPPSSPSHHPTANGQEYQTLIYLSVLHFWKGLNSIELQIISSFLNRIGICSAHIGRLGGMCISAQPQSHRAQQPMQNS